ncbi:STY4528 family pathogenicity island replication protein [Burkholderia pseudomallei]|uniref:STY4528 family pathogenicity island replication protein n=1 Tax=Burkholderia pseudomallei TaxID=28450 RepID=UPI0027E11D30|nr:STY4528 family pathogenicity island replication protein [Burkholderia pseudomallei]
MAARSGDAVLFSGNRHETVPRALFLDRRLTPLERNAWQVIRLQVQRDGITAFPTYEELAPYLASMPCTTKASSETVARALTVLRLTRWLSLVQRRRDPSTGRHQGNLYVLHDEPLSPFEAIQLDVDYLDLISRALSHASKAIQSIGNHVLEELATDLLLTGCVLPTRLQIITQRLTQQGLHDETDDTIDEAAPRAPSYPQNESEDGDARRLRMHGERPSESEHGRKPASEAHLRNPNAGRTVRIKPSSDVPTPVPRTRDALRLPARFATLRAEQQNGALAALQQVDPSLRQAVLDEWQARLDAQGVRKPAGYLFGIIGKALRGEFQAWCAPPSQPPASAPPAPTRPADADVVQHHLTRLRALLRLPPDDPG